MSHLRKRLTGVEALIGLQALDAYLNLPFVSWPDWALASVILGRRVTPAEMQSPECIIGLERRMEEIIPANTTAEGRRLLQQLHHAAGRPAAIGADAA